MKLRRRPADDPEINIAPLIDVVFLLLIFFMVSATFVHESRIRVHLPRAGHGAAVAKTEQVTVTVTADGAYRVNGALVGVRAGDRLRRKLGMLRTGKRTESLLIRAAGRATHQDVVTAMDAATGAGYTRIAIATADSGNAGETSRP